MLKDDYVFNKSRSVVYRVMWSSIDSTEQGSGRFHGKVVKSTKHPKSTYKIGSIRKRLMCKDHNKLSIQERRDLMLHLTLD